MKNILTSFQKLFFKKKAACLIIGDEILKGDVLDTNSHFLSQQMNKIGVQMCETRVCLDIIEEIVTHTEELRNKYDWVFTSGGIGSTHDDVTFEALSQVFNTTIERHELTFSKMKEFVPPDRITDNVLTLANLPKGCEVHYCEDYEIFTPLVQLENVFILPGVPLYFERILSQNLHLFRDEEHLPYSKNVLTKKGEGSFASSLKEIAQKFMKEEVLIGSYPADRYSNDQTFNCRINVSGNLRDSQKVDECCQEIIELVDGWLDKEKDDDL